MTVLGVKRMLKSSAADVVRRLVRGYERGAYTRMEVVSGLLLGAASHSPADLASTMPADWLDEVRKAVANPPLAPGDVVYLGSALLRPGADYGAWEAEMRQKSYEATWTWHRYFAS